MFRPALLVLTPVRSFAGGVFTERHENFEGPAWVEFA